MHYVFNCAFYFDKYYVKLYLDPNASRSESAISFCVIVFIERREIPMKILFFLLNSNSNFCLS